MKRAQPTKGEWLCVADAVLEEVVWLDELAVGLGVGVGDGDGDGDGVGLADTEPEDAAASATLAASRSSSSWKGCIQKGAKVGLREDRTVGR